MDLSSRSKLFLVLAAGIFVLAWLLPNHYAPWTSAYQEFASFFAGLVLVLVVSFLGFTKVSPVLLIFIFLSSIPLFQQLFGLIYFTSDALLSVLYLLGFSLMLMVGYNLSLYADNRYFFTMLLAWMLIFGAVLSLWVALRQWLLLSGGLWEIDMPSGGRPFANLAQPNNLATLLCMGLAGALFCYEKYLLGRISGGVLAAFLLFGVALTQSRTPWIIAFAASIFWMWKSFERKPRLRVRGLLIWFVFYGFCILILPSVSEGLLLDNGSISTRDSVSGRWTLWVQLSHAILRGPLWGYGWGQISVAQMGVATDFPAQALTTEYSHNIVLDLLLWCGPLLGGAVIIFCGWWLLLLYKRGCTSESLFTLIASGCLLLHGLVEYPFGYAYFLLPLGLLLGGSSAECPSSREFKLPQWLLGVGGAFAIGLFGWLWVEYRALDEYYRISQFENARIGEIKAGAVPEVLLLTLPREYVRFIRTPIVEDMSSAELSWIRRVVYRQPGAFSIFRYALALGINKQPDAARHQLNILRAQFGPKVHAQAIEALRVSLGQYPQLVDVFVE